MSAYVVSLGTDPDAAPPAPVRVVWANDLVHRDQTSGFEVRVSAAALERMRAECRDSTRRRGRRVETGGPLFGEIDEAAGVVWVSEAREPPGDSDRSSGQFVLGTAGLESSPPRSTGPAGARSGSSAPGIPTPTASPGRA